MQLTFPSFDAREIEYLKQCLDSGWVTQGPFVRRFEEMVARRHQVRHALATTSCTAGLHLATLALGLGPGDEVVVPAFTWITSANCAEYVGARVRFVDVDADTYNLAPDQLEAALTPRTRAVVVVHLFGLAADMDPILALCAPRGIAVIEDAACAIGTTYRGRPAGGLGTVGAFSFHPRKVVTTGEGGMVTTNDDALAERVASLRNHGSTGVAPEEAHPRAPWAMATFERLGYNLRLSDLQGAVGVAQMEKLDALLEERRAAARRYHELLEPLQEVIRPIAGPDPAGHSYQSYVIRLAEGGRERRNRVMSGLERQGIETRPGTHAVHTLGYYRRRYQLAPEDYPGAALCQDTTITLPLFPGITPEEQARVTGVLREALAAA